jgi:hypothetical protein
MPNKWWKQRERQLARFFGGVRNPLSGGSSRHTKGDIIHPILYAELKCREKHSAVTLWDDTAKKAKKEGRVPVVAMVEKNRPDMWLLIKTTDALTVFTQMDVVEFERVEIELEEK